MNAQLVQHQLCYDADYVRQEDQAFCRSRAGSRRCPAPDGCPAPAGRPPGPYSINRFCSCWSACLRCHCSAWTPAAKLPSRPRPPSKARAAASGNPYDVIAAVNQVRASNGLAAFQVNGALMAAAQAHSDYQAASGSISHTGSGGSSPGSRAAAAGYAGSVIENIYGGMNASPQQAVSWWQGDSLHLNTLLSTRHTEAGAGVASSGGVVYYTLDVGTGTGASSGSTGSTGASTPGASGAPVAAPATAVAFNPVLISTANPDGSIVHVVQAGQTLWTIAASYKIALADLLQLNGFTNNTYIYPGNKILIQPAGAAASASASCRPQERERPALQALPQQPPNPPKRPPALSRK